MEVDMIAKLIIKRRFKEGNVPQIFALLKELRTHAMARPGYISGETLTQSEDPKKMVVISTWQSTEEWYQWRDSEDRKKYEAMLEVYQESPTEIEEYVLGAPLLAEK